MAYCQRCNRSFAHQRALWQHENNSSGHNICASCQCDFDSWRGLQDHFSESPNHDFCRFCQEHFDQDSYDLYLHNEDVHVICYDCNTVFDDERDFQCHNCPKRWYCDSCSRSFQNQNNLDAHLNSSVHKDKNFHCPGANCGRSFVSMSAMLLHFEAGTCPSGMTRNGLNRLAVNMDCNNVITNPSRLISGLNGQAPATTTETWATELSWNSARDAYECFLCHGTFATLGGLNMHLRSSRHEERIYRCPNNRTCGNEFGTLSALTQHVESGKCGVQRFGEVQNALGSLLGGRKMISF